MDWIMNTFHCLQRKLEACEEISSSCVNLTLPIPGQILNDSVYQVFKPIASPSVEFVFFHGLNLNGAQDAHLRTWRSAEGSKLWLEWILEEIPRARILSVSYDAFAKRTIEHGLMDMHLTCENLVQDLIEAQVGQGDCPVVLVGHCIGCLVMKELCSRLDSIPNRNEREENLLFKVKGLFYYACPHHGSELADQTTGFSKGSLFEELTTLNKIAQRRNENFRKLREKYSWRTYGIQEGLLTTLRGFKGFIVQEASARHDVDGFYTDPAADHFGVCRPRSKISSSFRLLLDFVASVLEMDKEDQSPKFDISNGVGLEVRVKTLIQKLQGSQRLCLVGMGGIGKTTLANALYQSISGTFEYSCFLADVKEFMTKKNNRSLLQEKIIVGLFRKGQKVEKSFPWGKLVGKKVLIVLDDVEFRSQVEVMTELDGFSQASRIIATSRDSGFLIAEDFDCYCVNPLEPEESKKLFCLDAFNTKSIPRDYKERVEKFVQRCGGLPLALTVVGKYLYAVKDEEVWDDVLENLRLAQPLNGTQEDELWSVLRVSYESLASQEKQLFLDVATCFNGADLEMVKKAWKVCGWASSPDSGLKNLCDKGLVTIDGSDSVLVIRMHEVLRHLGQSIACPDPENVASHSRVCYDESNPLARTWPFDEGKAEVKVLRINCDVELNVERLHGLNALKILWIGLGVSLLGPCNLLPPKLAYMRLDGKWLPQTEGLHSKFTEPGAKSVAQRPALRYLEIRNSVSRGVLDTLGDFQDLQSLELHMQDWQALPEPLYQLRALKKLVVEDCNNLRAIQDTLGDLQSLEHLRISCPSFKGIPKTLSNLRALKYLVIQACTSDKVIPDTLGDLQNLEHLGLSCGCLKATPKALGKLRALRHLEMTGCHDWKTLSDIVGQLKTLQTFVMNSCLNCEVNDNIHQLEFLESPRTRRLLRGAGQVDLPVFHGKSVKIIAGNSELLPRSFGLLPGDAIELIIDDCRSLKALPDTLGQFKGSMRRLEIVNCDNLEGLPGTVGELQALRFMKIESCRSLVSLADNFGHLQALEELIILSCQNLATLPNNLGELQSLQRLHIGDCNGLIDLPDNLGNLLHLEELKIWNCKNLRVLPNSLGGLFRNLRCFYIGGCNALKSLPDLKIFPLKLLPDSVRIVPLLEELQIQECQYLESLPHGLGELGHLRRLHIGSCNGLRALPDSLGNLQALEQLKIVDCQNLESLPDSLGKLQHLRRLHIRNCNGLRVFADSLGNLHALEELRISHCQALEALPDTLGELPGLRHIEIRLCKRLKTLPDSLWQLRQMDCLWIESCENLESLPGAVGDRFLHLSVDVCLCNNLRMSNALEEHLASRLRSFRVRSCRYLKSRPEVVSKIAPKQGQDPSSKKKLRIRLRERP